MTKPSTKRAQAGRKGRPPVEIQKQNISLRLNPDLVADIEALAEKEVRSRSSMIEYILRQYVEAHK